MPDSLIGALLYYFVCITFLLFMGLMCWLGGRSWSFLRRNFRLPSFPKPLLRLFWRLDKRCTNCGGYPKLPKRPVCQPCSLAQLRFFGACTEHTGAHTLRRPKGQMPG